MGCAIEGPKFETIQVGIILTTKGRAEDRVCEQRSPGLRIIVYRSDLSVVARG